MKWKGVVKFEEQLKLVWELEWHVEESGWAGLYTLEGGSLELGPWVCDLAARRASLALALGSAFPGTGTGRGILCRWTRLYTNLYELGSEAQVPRLSRRTFSPTGTLLPRSSNSHWPIR
jgi:hypothetical protein